VSREPVRTPRIASRSLTSTALGLGVLVSAGCFLLAVAAEVATPVGGGDLVRDPAELLDGLAGLEPRSWASLGTYVLVVTPAIGLLTSAFEYARVGDRRTTLLAIAVLGVLVLGSVVALRT
jgi:hypothetical protein